MTRRALLLLLLLCGGCSTAQQKPFAWAVIALVALFMVGSFIYALCTDAEVRRAVLGVLSVALLLFVLGWAVITVNSCQRQPAPPQDAPDSAAYRSFFSIDTLRGATGDTLPLPHTYAMFSVLVRTDTQKVIIGNRLYVVIPAARPDTLTRQESLHAQDPARPSLQSSTALSTKVPESLVLDQQSGSSRVSVRDRLPGGGAQIDGWPLPSFIPHNLDTLRFIAPLRDAIPGSCAVDSSHFLTDSVWVWVERRYPTAPPWAPWHTAWHLVRRIRLAPGQPCTLNTARPAWHKFSVRDRAGNVSCADSIYSGPR